MRTGLNYAMKMWLGKGFNARLAHLQPCRVPCGLCWERARVSGLFYSQSQPQWARRTKSPSCALRAIILFTGFIEMCSFIMYSSCKTEWEFTLSHNGGQCSPLALGQKAVFCHLSAVHAGQIWNHTLLASVSMILNWGNNPHRMVLMRITQET